MFASIIAALTLTAAQPSLDITQERDMLSAGRSYVDVHSQLKRRAKQACRQNGQRGLDAVQRERFCTIDLLDKAVSRLNDRQLTAYHEGEVARLRLAQR